MHNPEPKRKTGSHSVSPSTYTPLCEFTRRARSCFKCEHAREQRLQPPRSGQRGLSHASFPPECP